MKSYFAKITAMGSEPLLGGVRVHVSSRFETRKMADEFGEQSIKANGEAGRLAVYSVETSEFKPEIYEREIA